MLGAVFLTLCYGTQFLGDPPEPQMKARAMERSDI